MAIARNEAQASVLGSAWCAWQVLGGAFLRVITGWATRGVILGLSKSRGEFPDIQLLAPE